MIGERRIEALRNMALHGTKHEAATARAILEKLNIEVSEPEPEAYFQISWKNKYEERILMQVIYMVIETGDLPVYSRKGEQWNKRLVKCTKSQYTEIDLFFSSYRRALEEELTITVGAFIQKNRIFSTAGESPEPRELTDEDRKILERARSVDRVEIRKRITAGGAN